MNTDQSHLGSTMRVYVNGGEVGSASQSGPQTGGDVSSVSISSDGSYVAAGSADGNVYLFDRTSSAPKWTHNAGEAIVSVDVSGSGDRIVAGGTSKFLCFSASSSVPKTFQLSPTIRSVSISDDGTVGAVGGTDDTVHCYDIPFFTLSLSTDEVALVEGQVSLTVTLSSVEGFNGDVQLSVGDPIPGVDASFSPNPVYLMNDAQSTLTLQLSGSPSQVKNAVRVVASGGGTTREASFMLYAFGDTEIGEIQFERQPAYDYAYTDSRATSVLSWNPLTLGPIITPPPDFTEAVVDSTDGLVFAKARAGPDLYADSWAKAMMQVDFPKDFDGNATLQATLRVKRFEVSGSVLLGITAGRTMVRLEGNGQDRERVLGSTGSVSVPLPFVDEVLAIVQAPSTVSQIVNIVNYYIEDDYETYTVSWTPEGMQNGQTYRLGAGVVASADYAVLGATSTAVVCGYVDDIKVIAGTAPAIDFGFNDSGNQGLTSGAERFYGSQWEGYDEGIGQDWYWGNGNASIEAWIKPKEKKLASVANLEKITSAIFADDYVFYYRGALCIGTDTDGFFFRKYPEDTGGIAGGTYGTDEWYHVVGVYQDGSFSLYVDGNRVGGPLQYSASPGAANVIYIGSSWIGDRWYYTGGGGWVPYGFYDYYQNVFNGLVEEVSIYDMALSQDEIGGRYRGGPDLNQT